jgi:hypothetical protein
MSEEPELKALIERAWRLRVESTYLKFQIAQAVAESICRGAAAVCRFFERRMPAPPRE